MNYYERHLGDYARDAGHLTMLEHGAYTLLLDRYYTTEQGIPADQAHRVCRARTRDEKEAVDTVLAEFFTLRDGVHYQKRVDAEIERYSESAPDREAKRENERERQRRARERRKELFDFLRGHGVVPAFDAPMSELQAAVSRIKSQQVTQPVTRDVTATQTPDTRHQEVSPIAPKGASKSAAVGLKAWIDAIKAKGEKPIPPGDPVLAYADKVGIPREYLVLAWQQFLHTYTTSRDGKRYRDWRKVFRNAVEANWLKLWYLDGQTNTYGLTTVGHQAQRAHDDRRAA